MGKFGRIPPRSSLAELRKLEFLARQDSNENDQQIICDFRIYTLGKIDVEKVCIEPSLN